MFKLILRYTFVGLFVAQFVMFVMLVTKQAFEDMPFFLPLPILTYFAKDLISKWCAPFFLLARSRISTRTNNRERPTHGHPKPRLDRSRLTLNTWTLP